MEKGVLRMELAQSGNSRVDGKRNIMDKVTKRGLVPVGTANTPVDGTTESIYYPRCPCLVCKRGRGCATKEIWTPSRLNSSEFWVKSRPPVTVTYQVVAESTQTLQL